MAFIIDITEARPFAGTSRTFALRVGEFWIIRLEGENGDTDRISADDRFSKVAVSRNDENTVRVVC